MCMDILVLGLLLHPVSDGGVLERGRRRVDSQGFSIGDKTKDQGTYTKRTKR